jgi:hypothetical protein
MVIYGWKPLAVWVRPVNTGVGCWAFGVRVPFGRAECLRIGPSFYGGAELIQGK